MGAGQYAHERMHNENSAYRNITSARLTTVVESPLIARNFIINDHLLQSLQLQQPHTSLK